MATIIHERVEAEPFDGLRISWGGIWGGVLVAMGTLLLLTTLGLAIGISAADPRETQGDTLGAAAAVWSGVSLLIAMFIGGMASTRLGMILDKTTGVLEGALVWVLSFLLILYLAGSGVGLVASGVAGLFGGVTQTVQSAVPNVDELRRGDVDQMLARLRDPQTARTIATASGVPQEEVRTALAQVEQRVQAVRDDPAQVATEIREGTKDLFARVRDRLPAVAAEIQPGAIRAAWLAFAAMAISLLAAIAGSMLGRRAVAQRLRVSSQLEQREEMIDRRS